VTAETLTDSINAVTRPHHRHRGTRLAERTGRSARDHGIGMAATGSQHAGRPSNRTHRSSCPALRLTLAVNPVHGPGISLHRRTGSSRLT
jgi:hypothetical protein